MIFFFCLQTNLLIFLLSVEGGEGEQSLWDVTKYAKWHHFVHQHFLFDSKQSIRGSFFLNKTKSASSCLWHVHLDFLAAPPEGQLSTFAYMLTWFFFNIFSEWGRKLICVEKETFLRKEMLFPDELPWVERLETNLPNRFFIARRAHF